MVYTVERNVPISCKKKEGVRWGGLFWRTNKIALFLNDWWCQNVLLSVTDMFVIDHKGKVSKITTKLFVIKQRLFVLVIYHKRFCYCSVVCQNILCLIEEIMVVSSTCPLPHLDCLWIQFLNELVAQLVQQWEVMLKIMSSKSGQSISVVPQNLF